MTSLVLNAFRELRTPKLDRVWLASLAVILLIAIFKPDDVSDRVWFGLTALTHTMPYVLFACLIIGALAAAGAISVADTARLLRTRGKAMQEAVPVGVGAMAALLGLDFEAAAEVAAEAAQGEVCQAANDNDPGQVVVSGHKAAVERAIEIAKTRGAKRAVLLPVSAPFHCALMEWCRH